MIAKEMFEKLGFKSQIDEDNYINWIRKNKDGFTLEIAFDYNGHSIEFYSYKETFDNLYNVDLMMKELQAINKQVEELGWKK